MQGTKLFRNTINSLLKAHDADLSQPGSSLTLDNEPYMRLSINRISTNVISVAHTYVQHGDLMSDPEMRFWTLNDDEFGYWYPIDYTQHGLGIYQEAVIFEDGKPTGFNKKLQAQLCSFANQWARNLKHQGFAEAPVKKYTSADGEETRTNAYDDDPDPDPAPSGPPCPDCETPMDERPTSALLCSNCNRIVDTVPADPKQATKLRALADNMQKTIDGKFADRVTNTARRQNMDESQRADSRRLQKIQAALRALADAWESGDIPNAVSKVTSKVLVEFILIRETFPTYADDVKRLDRAGITHAQKYQYVREWLLKAVEGFGEKTEADRIRKMEADICNGGKIPGFFPTPAPIVQMLIEWADIQPHQYVLEPSAGKGDIADALLELHLDGDGDSLVHVDCVEINHSLYEILKFKNHEIAGRNIFDLAPDQSYDRVVMNPPFENYRDVMHVMYVYEFLKPGGRLVSIVGANAQNSKAAKYEEFRAWLDEVGGYFEDLPEKAFAKGDVPTQVSTVAVVIDKAPVETAPEGSMIITADQIEEMADEKVLTISTTTVRFRLNRWIRTVSGSARWIPSLRITADCRMTT